MSNPNEQYIEKLQAMKLVSGLPEYQDALTAAIAALERENELEGPCVHCGSDKLKIVYTCQGCGWNTERVLPPLTDEEVAVVLKRLEDGDMEAQTSVPPTVDTGAVERLIDKIKMRRSAKHTVQYGDIGATAETALPALQSLLAERERLREDRRRLRRFVKEFRAWVGSDEQPETVFDVPLRDMEQRAEQLLEETKDD